MTDIDREKILRRIQKCLRLAESSNPHESAAALRQAKALMDAHGISASQADLADIVESGCKASGKRTIPVWEGDLASMIARTMGCRALFERGQRTGCTRVRRAGHGSHYRHVYSGGSLIFIGAGAAPAVARYAFEVLRRKLRAARSEFRDLTGIRDAQRLDAFSNGWIIAVRQKVVDLVPPDGALEKVDRALAERNPEMKNAETRDASGMKDGDKTHIRAAAAGFQDGLSVELHNGVGGIAKRAALGAP